MNKKRVSFFIDRENKEFHIGIPKDLIEKLANECVDRDMPTRKMSRIFAVAVTESFQELFEKIGWNMEELEEYEPIIHEGHICPPA